LKIHDLTRTISQDMQVYPGDPQPKFNPHATIKDNKANVTRIMLGSTLEPMLMRRALSAKGQQHRH
jgi:kynurenine formamidase